MVLPDLRSLWIVAYHVLTLVKNYLYVVIDLGLCDHLRYLTCYNSIAMSGKFKYTTKCDPPEVLCLHKILIAFLWSNYAKRICKMIFII